MGLNAALGLLVGCAGLVLLLLSCTGVMLWFQARALGPRLSRVEASIDSIEDRIVTRDKREAGRKRHDLADQVVALPAGDAFVPPSTPLPAHQLTPEQRRQLVIEQWRQSKMRGAS